jgi:hypothetical protein
MRSALGCSALLLSLAAGCIVVQPLEDYPDKAAGGSSSKAGSGGSDAAGSSTSGKGGTHSVAGGTFDDCKTNADCEEDSGGEPYFCSPNTHACTKLKTEVCPLVIGDDVFDPNAIIFGGFAPLSTTNAARNPIVYAHQLALEELSGDDVGGLPDGVDDVRRPLLMVICYNQDDRVEDALDHLIGTLHVPGIVANLKPGDLRRAYEDHPNDDVFFLSPVTVTESVATLEDDDKVWNMLGQPADYAPTYAALLKRAEAKVRATLDLDETQRIKVAMLTTPDAFDSDLANKVAPLLRFNDDRTATTNQADKNYQLFSLQGPAPQDIESKVADLVEFRPHIIISAASDVVTMVGGVVDQVETIWNAEGEDLPRPMYILSPFNAGDLTHLLTQLVNFSKQPDAKDIQQLFMGVSIAGPEDTSAQFDYEGRIGATFGNVFSDTANYYDATYLLAYASYAAGIDEPLSGTTIARGMKRLVSGPVIPIHPDNILDTFDALRDGAASVEIESTLGPPSFDARNGVRQIDGSVFCFNRSDLEMTVSLDTYRFDRTLGDLRKPKFADPFCIPDFFSP